MDERVGAAVGTEEIEAVVWPGNREAVHLGHLGDGASRSGRYQVKSKENHG